MALCINNNLVSKFSFTGWQIIVLTADKLKHSHMSLIRRLFFSCLLLIIFFNPKAQVGIREISKVKTQFLKYEQSEYSFDYPIPFRKIEIVDYRFDTTKIGYATYNRPDNHTRLVTKGGVQNFLSQRLNDYFKRNLDPGAPRTLVIVLKKLWL